jgi:hypothetical protein
MMSAGPSMRSEKAAVTKVTGFMVLIILAFVLQRHVTLVGGAFLCAGYALFYFRRSRVSLDQLRTFAVLLLLLLPAFIKPYHGLSPIFYVFSTFSVFFAAKAMVHYPPRIFFNSFRLIYTVMILAIGMILYKYWGHPEPFGEVIEGSSTNGIPAYLIIVQICFSLSSYLVKGRLPILSPILTGVVAFFGNGRGSLVIAGLIIAASLVFNLLRVHSMSWKRGLGFLVLFFSALVFILLNGAEWLDLLNRYTKLSVGLIDTNRLQIWDEYLQRINPWTLFVGASYEGTVIETLYRDNPHIAYIRTHSFFGLPATLAAMASPFFVFLLKRELMAQLVFFFFIGMAALRAATEPLLFPTLLDFFYFLCFFLYVRYAAEKGAYPGKAQELVK